MANIIPDLERFSDAVLYHIEHYTVPQYGDWPEDNAAGYTVGDCLWQMRKYATRHGRNVRDGQDAEDLIKIANYACIAAMIAGQVDMAGLGKSLRENFNPGAVPSIRARSWILFFEWLQQATLINGWFDTPSAADSVPDVRRLIQSRLEYPDVGASVVLSECFRIAFSAAMAWKEVRSQEIGVRRQEGKGA